MTTIDGTDVSEITIDGTDVQEVTVDGDVVWTGTTWVEDFEHNDLSGRYGSFNDFNINTNQPYTGSYSLEAPYSSGGEKAFADTSQFSNTASSGSTYRTYVYITSDSSSRRARFYVGSNGQDPSSGDGYRVRVRSDDMTLKVEAWENGTLIDVDEPSISSIPTGQWDYFEFSYANSNDAGGSTFEVDYVTGGSVEATASVGTTTTGYDDWGFEKPYSWATHYFGGIEQL